MPHLCIGEAFALGNHDAKSANDPRDMAEELVLAALASACPTAARSTQLMPRCTEGRLQGRTSMAWGRILGEETLADQEGFDLSFFQGLRRAWTLFLTLWRSVVALECYQKRLQNMA